MKRPQVGGAPHRQQQHRDLSDPRAWRVARVLICQEYRDTGGALFYPDPAHSLGRYRLPRLRWVGNWIPCASVRQDQCLRRRRSLEALHERGLFVQAFRAAETIAGGRWRGVTSAVCKRAR